MLINTSASPYYITGDGIKDNGPEFIKLQKAMAKSNQHNVVYLPAGIILSSFTRWLFNVRSFKVIGNNTILRSLYSGTDEAQARAIFSGEMMQNNVLEYSGKKEYVLPDPIQTAKAGDKLITLNQPGKYKVGERMLIRAGDLFAGGYPRACRSFDWVEAEDIKGNVVTLKMPLSENFFDYDNPEVFSLDRTENPYCELAEFEGITLEGNFAYPARKLVLNNCKITGWLWISECEQVITNDVYADKIEADKLVKKWTANNLRSPSSPVNGGSIYEIVMNDCQTGSIRLCPRYLTVNKPKIWANKVIKDETKQEFDYAIPCIADAPARNPIRRLTIDQATFMSGSESQADKNLEFAPLEEIEIPPGIGNIVLTKKEQATKIEAGMMLNNANGTNGGVVKSIRPDGSGDVYVFGSWATPIPGEKWLWSHVKEVIDYGGHHSLNDKIGYGPQSKRWQGNTSTGEIKEMHLTEQDFTGSNPRITMNCWIVSIEGVIGSPGTGIEIANIGEVYQSLYKTSSIVAEPARPVWSKYIDLIGKGGRFEIVVKWKSF